MNKFPYKILLTIPKVKVKNDILKTIMSLRPSAYRIFELEYIQYEWEYKSQFMRDKHLSNISDTIKNFQIEQFDLSIVG
jgi:hypothetical protein